MNKAIKLGQVTKAGLGTIIGIMFALGVIYKISNYRSVKAAIWVAHTYNVKAEIAELQKKLVDLETGQRGFIYTGKETFLEPYNQALSSIDQEISQFKELVNEQPEQIVILEKVEDLVAAKLAELATTIELKKAGQEEELMTLVAGGEGKIIMDEIRIHLEAMLEREEKLLEKRQAAATKAEQIATISSIGGTGLAIALALISLVFVDKKVVRPINEVTNVLASSSTEIAAAVQQQEKISSEQAHSIDKTASTMDELSNSARISAEQAESAAAGARQVLALAQTGTETVDLTLGEMTNLKEKVSAIAAAIMRLNEQTNQISKINNLVSDVAMQTNMLALNAAVEAVRAGEQGKGFGVVASEIRKLADLSKQSANQINVLIDDIQQAIKTTVVVTNEGEDTVNDSLRVTRQTATTFTSMVEAIDSIVLSSQQISLTATQQAAAIKQVLEVMNNINQGAVETASGISQTRVGMQKMNEAAFSLKAVV